MTRVLRLTSQPFWLCIVLCVEGGEVYVGVGVLRGGVCVGGWGSMGVELREGWSTWGGQRNFIVVDCEAVKQRQDEAVVCMKIPCLLFGGRISIVAVCVGSSSRDSVKYLQV